MGKGILTGVTKKKYVKADLKALGISKENNKYLLVNTDGNSYKIKTNYTGERKKIHLTKDIYNLLINLVNQLEQE
jgi:hypothetical protein